MVERFNRHVVMDVLPVVLASFVFRGSLLFRDSIDSPSYGELLGGVEMNWPCINGEGIYEVPASTVYGELDPAFCIARWKGDRFPTLIYHHGNNERPFQNRGLARNTFKKVFLDEIDSLPVNLVGIRAAYHRSFNHYRRHMGRLATFTNLLAVSARMVEELTGYAHNRGSRVLVSGFSLGGWVTNLHRAFYNSADCYVPLMAGNTPGDVFTCSVYRLLAANLVRENPSVVENRLSIEKPFLKVTDNNVFPLLARHDQLIRFDRQKASYGRHPVAVIDRGHITATMAAALLRRHVLSFL